MTQGNPILAIAPYWAEDLQTWVFDDDRVGLVREPFVSGVPEMINHLVSDIPDARGGFRMTFSASPFPGHASSLSWIREEYGGNWYKLNEEPHLEGWLCPALFHYFNNTPENLYVAAAPLVSP